MAEDIDFGKLVRGNMASDNTKRIEASDTYSPDDFYVSLRFTDLMDARLMTTEALDGKREELGVFIPIRQNGMLVTEKRNVIMTFCARVSKVATSRYSHVLTPVMDKEMWDENKRLGFSEKIVGHMRPVIFKNKGRKRR